MDGDGDDDMMMVMMIMMVTMMMIMTIMMVTIMMIMMTMPIVGSDTHRPYHHSIKQNNDFSDGNGHRNGGGDDRVTMTKREPRERRRISDRPLGSRWIPA